VDPKVFILTGGKVQNRPEPVADPMQVKAAAATTTIGAIFNTYAETLTPGS
jgi:hypothetical protein